MDKTRPQTIDDYIASYPGEVSKLLQKIRLTIRKAAPEAIEKISYSMPAFYQNGTLVWFAASKEHIGLYPTPSAITAFKKELSRYEVTKGTIRFPIDKPIPLALVSRIVRFRVKHNLNKNR